MKKKSIKLNAILNIIKSILSILFPIITFPYATRVLGVENIGKVNYGSSIITYYSLIASFGISVYAVREGSKIKDNSEKLNDLVSELFTVNMITTIFSYSAFFIFSTFIDSKYKTLLLLQSLVIVFTTLGVDWINVIFEDYFFITIRSIITNILSLVILFVFVRKEDDIYIYALINVFTVFFVGISNYFHCKKYVSFRLIKKCNLKKHINKMKIFFLNAIAVSIYVSSDITLLGIFKGDYEVGIYTVSTKVYTVFKTIFAAIYIVALPQMTEYYAKKYIKQFYDLCSEIISYLIILLLPISVGVIFISKTIVYLLAGKRYFSAILPLQILTISLIFAIFGGVFTQCINVATNNEKHTAFATILSALENILLNLILIPRTGAIGAAITTAISELTVLGYCIYKNKKLINSFNIEDLLTCISHSMVGCFIIVVEALLLSKFTNNIIQYSIILISTSIIFYVLLLIVCKNKLVINMLKKIKFLKR